MTDVKSKHETQIRSNGSHFFIVPVNKRKRKSEDNHFFIVPIDKISDKNSAKSEKIQAEKKGKSLSKTELKSLNEILQKLDSKPSQKILDIESSILKKLEAKSKQKKISISNLINEILCEHFNK